MTASPENLPDVPRQRMPRHIAIIMDGNGRWAVQQGRPRVAGHEQGAKTVQAVTEEAARLGLDQLTLYCLSSENWKRPQNELDFLMVLLHQYLVSERDRLMDNNIRLRIIGRREPIPEPVLAEMDHSVAMTAENTGLTLCLAINYGARTEIVDAVRSIAGQVAAGELAVDQIDESCISEHLYTRGMSDPDLLIRTAGEMRLSNYLLWQISYAELWVTPKLWPEFAIDDFHEAIRDYSRRDRRFGGLNSSDGCADPQLSETPNPNDEAPTC